MPLTDAELGELIEEANARFNTMCEQRHEMGAEKYGETTFLQNDTLEMALEELVDLSNYARYTFIRVSLLQRQLAAQNEAPGNFQPVKGG